APLPPTDIRVATTESAGSYIHIISWTPGSDDNSGVLGYRITAETERGAKDLANAQLVTGTEFTISTALSSSLYVTICTVDRAGNPSADIGWPDLGRVINYSWEYDELGNRTVQTKNSVTTSYNWYSDTNELKQILQGLAVVNLEYDANGNNTKRTTVEPSKADEVWDYVYDTENRLVSVSQDGTLLAAYDYDAFGRRIRSVVAEPGKPAVLTVFIYVGGKVLYEERYQVPSSIVDPASALDLDLTFLIPLGSTDYVQGPAGLVAKAVTTAGGIGEVLTYYHQDHLGSTRVQTDADGGLLARFDYQPFGELLEAVYADPMTQSMEPFAYTGQRAEENIGLYYYGARFYDPAIGRFITQDPAQDGLNWYAYCNNNPILYTDPTGTKMAVGSSKDDEDDTTEGQHVWTGNETYDVDHAAVDTAIDKGTDEAYQEYFQYQDAVYSSNNLWWKPREITRVFEAWLAKNADELDVGDFWAWLGRVKTGGVWDIKRWKGVAGVSNFKFRGMNVEYDDLGNINYGYTGNDIGLSLNTLILGSEAVALKHGGVDDPKDHFWIHAGYWMYP
ncbi:MAG: RHS repeat-associated core domain-containing protein, partial [Methanocella sp.]